MSSALRDLLSPVDGEVRDAFMRTTRGCLPDLMGSIRVDSGRVPSYAGLVADTRGVPGALAPGAAGVVGLSGRAAAGERSVEALARC